MTDLTTEEHTKAHSEKIKGYRQLNESEIAAINSVKALGETIGEVLDSVAKDESLMADSRWFAMARTDLQVGIMKLVRAIAQPSSF